MFESKKHKTNGKCKMLHNRDVCDLHRSSGLVAIIKFMVLEYGKRKRLHEVYRANCKGTRLYFKGRD
jgi:hypothetical protein